VPRDARAGNAGADDHDAGGGGQGRHTGA
jgi:hypothetical protein